MELIHGVGSVTGAIICCFTRCALRMLSQYRRYSSWTMLGRNCIRTKSYMVISLQHPHPLLKKTVGCSLSKYSLELYGIISNANTVTPFVSDLFMSSLSRYLIMIFRVTESMASQMKIVNKHLIQQCIQ